jgi:hypothetical protein
MGSKSTGNPGPATIALNPPIPVYLPIPQTVRAICRLFGGGGSGGLDDIHLSARKGVITVRAGKGGKYREVPVHAQLRPDLALWSTTNAPPARGPSISGTLGTREASPR